MSCWPVQPGLESFIGQGLGAGPVHPSHPGQQDIGADHDASNPRGLAPAPAGRDELRRGRPSAQDFQKRGRLDPRAPEWEGAVKAHFAWWDKIIERKKKNGEVATILTEFGPPDYMPTLPYTRQPLSDQNAINVYMMKLLRQRYL